ncbi:TetR family transcriptional regulator [Demequina aurantiaca]|uniref:TetR family transcriptional regulator n=1 Tax=Demequina aurantiaca TaxID=676200 RepID=UPI003D34433C
MTRAAHNRGAILDAAALEILDHGYAEASLSAIALRLGLSKGALSYHFPTKHLLATHLIQSLKDAIDQAYSRARTQYPESAAVGLVAFFVHLGATVSEHDVVRAGSALYLDRAIPPQEVIQLAHTWNSHVTALLTGAHDQGDLEPYTDPLTASEYLLAATVGGIITSERSPRGGDRSPLHLTRLSLAAIGMKRADDIAERVLADLGPQSPVRLGSRA